MKKINNYLLGIFILFFVFNTAKSQPVPIMYDGDTLWVHPTDNSTAIIWGGDGIDISDGNGSSSNKDGALNTAAIVSQIGSSGEAAYLCDTLSAFGFDNWYLPSRNELDALYQNKDIIGGFVDFYLSSTEGLTPKENVCGQYFVNGHQFCAYDKSTNIERIRCVRKKKPFDSLSISASTSDASSYGTCDGTIDLSVSGGSRVYAYSWNNGEITQDLTGLCPGTYKVTITDTYNSDEVYRTYHIVYNKGYAILNGDTIYVSPDNISTGIEWGAYETNISTNNGAESDSNGAHNNLAIVKELGTGNYAAYLCDTLNLLGQDDWYLPAKEELNAMYNSKDDIGGFAADYYWSSTEYNANWSYNQNFDGGSFGLTNKNTPYHVRCVRRTNPFDPLEIKLDTIINETTNSTSDGEIQISTSGGSTYYAYSWSNSETNEDINGLTFGTYSVTLTDTYTSKTVIDSFTVINDKPYSILNNDTIWVYPLDNSAGIEWGGHGTVINMGNGAICDTNGAANTAAIVKQLGAGNYAAYYCDTLNIYGYDDWYLPALEELNAIRAEKDLISDISPSNYWTSTEFSNNDAWTLNFSVISGAGFNPKNTLQHLRCVRKENAYNDLVITVDSILEVIDGNDGGIFITVSGGDKPYTYSWSNGATNQNITGLARGFYSVTVVDSTLLGEVSDSFEVTEPAALTLQPDSQNICIGSNVLFTVSARGNPPIHYQWKKDGNDITGDTLNTLSLSDVDLTDDAIYTCFITNDYGSITSDSAKLNVIELSTNVGADIVFCNDTAVQLNANGNTNHPAESGTLAYQWSPATGLSSTTIENPMAQPTSPATYMVTLSDDVGCLVSDTIHLESKTPVSITLQPVSQNICMDDNVTFSTNASGTTPIHYQWKKNGIITGDTTTSISINGVDLSDEAVYTCEISNYCRTLTTNSATLNVIDLSIDVGEDITFCNDTAVQLNANGNTNHPAESGTLAYQWSPSTGLSSTMIENPVAQPTSPETYMVTLSDDVGCLVYDTIHIDSKTPVSITLQPVSKNICIGNDVTFSTNATGTAPIHYQWKKDGVDMAGDTTTSISLTGVDLSDEAIYTCEISNYCRTLTTDSATLNVIDLSIGVGKDITFCNDTAVQLDANGNTNHPAESGTLAYQWSPSTGLSATNIENPLAQPTSPVTYMVTLSDDVGCSITDTIHLESKTPVSITLQPVSQNICIGDNVTFSTNASGTIPIHYQWKKDGIFTGDTTTSVSLTDIDLSDEAVYTCEISNYCRTLTTDSATLNVIDLSIDAGTDVVFCNDTAVQLDANGNTNHPAESGTLVYQWGPSTGLSATNIADPLAQPISPVTYTVTLSDDEGCAVADDIYLDAKTPVSITSQPVSQNICIGNNAAISLTADGTANHYQWKKDGIDMTGDTLSSLSISGATLADDAEYYCEISNYCNSAISDTVKLNIIELSVDAGSNVVFCNDTAVQLQATGSSNYPAESGILSYAWNPSTGLSATDIENPVAQPTSPVTYIVGMSDEVGCIITDTIFLDSRTPVSITLQPAVEEIVCVGENNVSFDVGVSGTAPISYQWKKDGVDMPSDTTASLQLSGISLADDAIYYCEISNYCNSVSSDSAVLKVVNININLTDKGICTEGSVQLDAAVSNNHPAESGTLTYQWTPSAGLDNTTIANPLATPESTTTYKLVVTDDLGCIDSGQVEVFVQKPFQNEQICIVTVDPATAKNMVVWEKTPDKGTKAFRIYRESVIAGDYTQIGYLPYDSVSSFIDKFAEPRKQQYIYKITSEDTCGNESSLDSCEAHKTLLLQYSGSTGGINLMWHKYEINGMPLQYDTYQIFRGTDSINLSYYDMVSGNTFAYVDIDPAALKQKMYYRIYGILGYQCYANAKLKANAGPFSQSLSNLEDNRLKGSINQLSKDIAITVYPNPADDELNIQTSLFSTSDISIKITNTVDQIKYIKEITNINKYDYTIDVSNWPAGLYFIQAVTDKGTKTIKIIIH